MHKFGLQHNEADDFDHPKPDDESPLKRHVLYRLSHEKYTQEESSWLNNIAIALVNKDKKFLEF